MLVVVADDMLGEAMADVVELMTGERRVTERFEDVMEEYKAGAKVIDEVVVGNGSSTFGVLQ